jgi:hypothetical protein
MGDTAVERSLWRAKRADVTLYDTLPGDVKLKICAMSGCSGLILVRLFHDLYPRDPRDIGGGRRAVISSEDIVHHVTNYMNARRTEARPLLHAIMSEREEVVRDVIRWYGSTVPGIGMAHSESLYRAVKQGGEGIMCLLMGWTGYFDAAARISGLKRAVVTGQADMVRLLIVGYEDRNQRRDYEEALAMAISSGHNEIVRIFVDFDYSEPSFKAVFKRTLIQAVTDNNVDVARLILESPNVPDSASVHLTDALYTTTGSRMMTFLLDWLAPHEDVERTLLMIAVINRNKYMIRVLLNRPRDATIVNGILLGNAVSYGDVEIVNLLLGRIGDDRQAVVEALHIAMIYYGTDSDIAKLLSDFHNQM